MTNKKEIKLYFDGSDTAWVIDTDIHLKFVMVGFEEHELTANKLVRKFATEQLLDKEDLEVIKLLIERTLSEME